MKMTDFPLTELTRMLSRGDISSKELTAAYLERIAERDGAIGAYITVQGEEALRQAEKRDQERLAGSWRGSLHGVPAAMKDNLCTRGLRTTCASRMLADFVPPYSATAWSKLEQDGCVLLGKTNMDEFAMGSTTENSAFHLTRNPIDPQRVPGGSSGGSAAAVADGMAAFALGSDTGGSVRQPAAFCGVVGMKPTYGTVSRSGLIAFASSLDQIGPITRTVADNAMVLDAIAGPDAMDATSLQRAYAPFGRRIGQEVQGLRVGLPAELMTDAVDAQVKDAVMEAARVLEGCGARVEEVRLPTLSHALEAYYVMSSAEASSNLARYDGVRYGRRADEYEDLDALYVRSRSEGFGAEVKRRMLLGAFVLSQGHYDAYYKKAQQVRTLVIREFGRVFSQVDALLSPAAPTLPWRIGEKREEPMEAHMMDMHTVPASIAGIPAMSVPFGRNAAGLSDAIQLMGPAFSEPVLYQIGHVLEQEGRERHWRGR